MRILWLSLISIPLVLAFSSGFAQRSRAEEYCHFLRSMAEEAEKSVQKRPQPSAAQQSLNEIVKLTTELQNREPLEKKAIAQRMNFESFQQMALTENVKVSDYYKSSYIKNYSATVCGPEQLEANGSVAGARKTSTDRDFNPSGHPYYNEMKKRAADR